MTATKTIPSNGKTQVDGITADVTKVKSSPESKKAKTTMPKTKAASKKSDSKKSKKEIAPVDKLMADNTDLKTAVQQIEAQFGQGSIMALGNDSKQEIRGIPTGSLSLDMALGGAGLPCGRIVEIYGPESSGKTSIGLTRGCRSSEKWRYRGHRRCRARVRSYMGQEVGRVARYASGQPTQQR